MYKRQVLHGISLQVDTGSALALLGPNGAGKSTLLKVIAGQLAPTTGTVEFSGRSMGRNASESLARTGVCMIPEGRSVFPNLTVRENLLMYTYRRQGLKASSIEEKAFARFPVLGVRHKQLAGTLSGGCLLYTSRPAPVVHDEGRPVEREVVLDADPVGRHHG